LGSFHKWRRGIASKRLGVGADNLELNKPKARELWDSISKNLKHSDFRGGLFTAPAAGVDSEPLGHPDDWKHYPAAEWDLVSFEHGVTECGVQWFARKGRNKNGAAKARIADGLLACQEDASADAAPRPIRMDEESANARRLERGVERSILARAITVPAENRAPPAPSAAADDLAIFFDHEIGSVPDQETIHAKYRSQRSLHLGSRVMRCLQAAHRMRDQRLQRGNVGFCGKS